MSDDVEALAEVLAEHRRNEVDEPGGGRVPIHWRVRCEGRTCEFYAERPTWFQVCAAHEEHLAEVLAAHVAAARAEAWERWAGEVRALAARWQHTPDHYCCELCQLRALLPENRETGL